MTAIETRVVEALQKGPLTVTELAVELEIARGYAWNVLRGLEMAGLIQCITTRSGVKGPAAKVYAVIAESRREEGRA